LGLNSLGKQNNN